MIGLAAGFAAGCLFAAILASLLRDHERHEADMRAREKRREAFDYGVAVGRILGGA